MSSMSIWRWISFSSFCVASWAASWSGVFILRSSSASMCLNGFGLRWSFLWWGLAAYCKAEGGMWLVFDVWRRFACRGVEVAGLAFLWMAFLVAGVVGVSLWRLGALCVSCSSGGLVVMLAVVFGFRATACGVSC
jgi:hypothetical protein